MERKLTGHLRLQKVEAGHYETPDGRFQVMKLGQPAKPGWMVSDRLGGGKRVPTKQAAVAWIKSRLIHEAAHLGQVGGPDGEVLCTAVVDLEEDQVDPSARHELEDGLGRAVQAAVDLVATLRALATAGATAAEALEELGRIRSVQLQREAAAAAALERKGGA